MIVVDTNIVASLWLPTEWSESSERLLTTEPEWSAPLLWRSEFLNVLATYVRTERLELAQALDAIEAAEALFIGREFSVGSMPVLSLAAESGCTAYDCEFVVVARYLSVPLVTLDQKLLTAFPEVAIQPNRFLGDA